MNQYKLKKKKHPTNICFCFGGQQSMEINFQEGATDFQGIFLLKLHSDQQLHGVCRPGRRDKEERVLPATQQNVEPEGRTEPLSQLTINKSAGSVQVGHILRWTVRHLAWSSFGGSAGVPPITYCALLGASIIGQHWHRWRDRYPSASPPSTCIGWGIIITSWQSTQLRSCLETIS